MKSKLAFQMRKKQSIALVIFAVLIVGFRLSFYYFKNSQKEEENIVKFINPENENSDVILTEFDPNDLSEEDWINLGFSEKQTKTILKYKEIVGGKYISKEQLKKCYAISDEKFEEIEDYILLPETNKDTKNQNFQNTKFAKKELNIKGKFNPDNYTQKDWENLGFSEKQANAILKYKNYLGGSFVSKEKFRECFIISDENYQKLAPYLILPEKITAKTENIKLQNFDPNRLSVEDWTKLGFSQKQAEVIINYKNKKLQGNFKNLDDIKHCFVISEKKFEELKPYIKIQIEQNKSIENQNIEVKKSENINFQKIDLNKINFEQLVAFGFDKKQASSYLGFRNKLGGFVNTSQILETYHLDKDLAEKLISTCPLDAGSVAKYSLADAPEAWLKTHPYFKYYADKIIFYRMSEPNEAKIWKFIKAKPEQEAKMRLYLK